MITTRPWGTYEVIQEGENYLVKKIVVNPGSRLSLQSHNHRAEHWVIVDGVGTSVLGEDSILVGRNSHIFVPVNAKHRISNTSNEHPLVMVEVQTGSVLEESDIVRYQDDYSRV